MNAFWVSLFILPIFLKSCDVKNCIQCSSTSPNVCLQCHPSFSLSRIGCGYSEINLLDQVSNCEIQTEDFKCERCNSNYHIYEGFCQADCNESCVCFEPNICEESFAIINPDKIIQADNQCSIGCLRCSSPKFCLECEQSYSLFVGQCYYCPIQFCEDCYPSNVCVSCAKYFYLSSGQCFNCPNHCPYCYGSSDCRFCDSGYNVHEGICKKEVSSSHSDNSNTIPIVAGVLSGAGLVGFFICVCLCTRRRNNRLADQNQSFVSQQSDFQPPKLALYDGDQCIPPVQSDEIIGSARLAQLDGRNMVLEQENCAYCGKSFSMNVETILLPCDHAFHGQCVQIMIGCRGVRSCFVCNMKFI